MSSNGKKKKRSTEIKSAAKPAAYCKYDNIIRLTAPPAVFLLSFWICLIMGHTAVFGTVFGIINSSLALLATSFILNKNMLSQRSKKLLADKIFLTSLSAMISALSLTAVYIAVGMQPFGDKLVISGDMSSQYLPFVLARNRAMLSGGSMIYSDSFGLGSGTRAIAAYYSASPLTLFSLPLSIVSMPGFMCFMQIAKTAVSGGAFAYFYIEKFRRNDLSACVFGLMYAMMTYSVSNLVNIIWLDCLLLLPLIILGAERLMDGRSAAMYVASLGLSIYSNYYISFMTCIYLVLYFIVYTAMHTTRLDLKACMKSFARFTLCSIWAACLAATSLLPSAVGLSQAAPNVDDFAQKGLLNYDPLRLIGKFLWGSDLTFLNTTLPNVYISIFGVVLLALFWSCGEIDRRHKIGYSVLLAVPLVSTLFSYSDFVWHGFHITIGLPYRYSFLISFTMLLMGAELWVHAEKVSFDRAAGVTGIFIALIFANYLLSSEKSVGTFVISLVLMLLSVTLIAVRSGKYIGGNAFAVIALLLVFSDLTLSGADTINKVGSCYPYWKRQDYADMVDMNSRIVDRIKISDSDIYRIEDENYSLSNEGVCFDYASLSGYSTPSNGSTIRLMDAMGYACDGINKYAFNLYTPFSDSVLNLKYIMSGDSAERRHLRLTDISVKGKQVYQNKLVLPRAFALPSEVEQWDIENCDPFEVQNELGRLSSGEQDGVYLSIPEANGGNGCMVIIGGRCRTEYKMPCDGSLFCFFDGENCDEITVSLNQDSYTVEGDVSCIFPLYEVKKGDMLTIEFKGKDGSECYSSAAMQNEDALLRTIEKMSQHPMSFEKYDDGYIEGSICVEQDCLLFTSIPYERGWSLQLDGQPTEPVMIGGSLIGIRLHNGENRIKMVYRSASFTVGATVSVLSLLIFTAWFALTRKNKINFSRVLKVKILRTAEN